MSSVEHSLRGGFKKKAIERSKIVTHTLDSDGGSDVYTCKTSWTHFS